MYFEVVDETGGVEVYIFKIYFRWDELLPKEQFKFKIYKKIQGL